MRSTTIIVAMAIGSALHLPGQDVHFSQFHNAPLVLNPAQAGDIHGDQRLSLMHRSQWRSVGSPFRTHAMSYDVPLFRGRMGGRYLGIGIGAFSDRAGTTRFGDTQANLSIAYALRAGRSSLVAFGLQGGYGQRSATLNDMRWDSQYNGAGHDPTRPSGEVFGDRTASFIDLGAGVLAKGGEEGPFAWRTGASVFHLHQPVVALNGELDDRLLRRYVVHAELEFEGRRWTWRPQAYVAQQGGSRELVYGALVHRRLGVDSRFTDHRTSNAIRLGCLHRWGDAVVPMLQFEYHRKLVAGISYDVNVSRLRTSTAMRGGMEVSVQWVGVFSDKRVTLPRGKTP